MTVSLDFEQGGEIAKNLFALYTWFNKGCVLAQKSLFFEAIECFDEAIKLNPNNYDVWVKKGGIFEHIGFHEEAIECFEEAFKLKPSGSDDWCDRGIEFIGKFVSNDEIKYLEKSTDFLNEAIKLNPNNYEAWYQKAYALEERGLYDATIICCNEIIKLNPNDTRGYFHRANARQNLKDYVGAIEDYSKSIEIDPYDYFIAYDNCIEIYEIIRNDEGAKEMKKKKEIAEEEYEEKYKDLPFPF